MQPPMHISQNSQGANRAKATPSIQSLDRGLLILESVGKSADAVSVAELTGVLGIDHSSVFRLANTLKRRGFLACPSGRKGYILGPSMWRLAHRYDWSNMLVTIARPYLKLLASQTGETAHLAIRERDKALFVDHVTGSQVVAVAGQVGELLPLYCTALGKALLVDHTVPQLESLLGAGPLRAYTSQTIVSVEALAGECAGIASRGFARDAGEFQDGLRCVAAPIRDRDGAIIGSIGISAPANRLPEERYDVCGLQVLGVTRVIHEGLSARAQEASAGSD